MYKRIVSLLVLLFIGAIPFSAIGMEYGEWLRLSMTDEDNLRFQRGVHERWHKRLAAVGNWHDPEPTRTAPLDDALITTPFWREMAHWGGPLLGELKTKAFKLYALNWSYPDGDIFWHIQRYQIAAGVKMGKVDPNTELIDILNRRLITPMSTAIERDDSALVALLKECGAKDRVAADDEVLYQKLYREMIDAIPKRPGCIDEEI